VEQTGARVSKKVRQAKGKPAEAGPVAAAAMRSSTREGYSMYRNAIVAVTGAAGTVGRALVDELLTRGVREVRGLDINEGELFFQVERLKSDGRYVGFLVDVRNRSDLMHRFEGCDYIFHAAALKQVPLCEVSPNTAVDINIIGVQNVIEAARSCRVKRVLFTSSDKAANPTNVMGTTKLMGERLFTAANATNTGPNDTIFASCRFGNVAGSKGSVIPLFVKQIAEGGPVTLTDPDMTRFLMRLDESVKLILKSIELARGGEVFVMKMPVMRIEDLARVMVQREAPKHGRDPKKIEVKIVGKRSGEKLYEELLTEEETRRSLELEDLYIVLPAFRNVYNNIKYEYPGVTKTVTEIYTSRDQTFEDEAFAHRLLDGTVVEK
jgi:FlaA1/EpsC-like NDP-sugar epimerase